MLLKGVEGQIMVIVSGIQWFSLMIYKSQEIPLQMLQQSEKDKMNTRFILTDPGRLEHDLGVEKLTFKTWWVCIRTYQSAYVKKILNNFNMSECNAIKTHLTHDFNLSLMDSPEKDDPILRSIYRAIV